jgi:amidase
MRPSIDEVLVLNWGILYSSRHLFRVNQHKSSIEGMDIRDWKALAAHRRQSLLNKIPPGWHIRKSLANPIGPSVKRDVMNVPRESGILTQRELEITEKYDATALVEKLATSSFSSYEVTMAFCKRAAVAHQVTFCLTEIFFDEALARAQELDDHLAKTGKPVGPLHGLPVSLKDLYKVKGIDATICFIANLNEPPSNENSSIVDLLLARGAVLYVKTNLPQTMMSLDSDNNVFGRTLNPHNSLLSPGGSSGGEGALVAMRGSVLGVGTDIAGSIRVPALCTGIYGFKPTANRVPYGRLQSANRPGIPGIESVAGPVANSARDLHLFLNAVIQDDVWDIDESALHLPWRNLTPPSRPLRIGVITESDHQPIHPPVLRSLITAQSILSRAGHTLVELDGAGSLIHPSAVIAWKTLFVDTDPLPFHLIKQGNEPTINSLTNGTQNLVELSDYEPTLEALFQLNAQRSEMKVAFRRFYTEQQLDVILMPGNQSVAPPHDTYGVPEYTALANLLNFPAAIIPFLNANAEADKPFKRDVEYKLPYDATIIEGLPSHIQLMGKPLQDEQLQTIVELIDAILIEG